MPRQMKPVHQIKMQTKHTRGANPILIYLAVILLAVNAIFLGVFLFKGNNPVKLTPSLTQIPTTPTVISPTASLTGSSLPIDIKSKSVNFAWFTYLPKKATDILLIAKWFDLFILIQGDEDNRDLVKSMGVTGPILQYLEFETIQDPGSCTAEPEINQVTYLPGDFCQISKQHPDWFLLNNKGQRIRIADDDNSWYLMDPGNPGWRAYFLERVKQFQSDPNWDGVFLDNVPVTLAFREDEGNIPASYPDDASYQTAIRGFLKFLHDEYFQPNSKLLFANLVSRRDDSGWVGHLENIDGAMYEGWALDWPDGYRPADVWEEQLQVAEQTQQAGKYIILVSLGTKQDAALQQFAFASYLLINQGHAAFRYSNSSSYNEIWLYDDYSLDLGDPLGDRYKVESEWRRDFTNGSVTVNPITHKVEITVKP